LDYSAYSSFYDDEYADYTEDVAFYLKWARRYPPRALELGCGTGRVLVPLAKAGIAVTGIEKCPAMLEQARLKLVGCDDSVKLVEGDMADFDLGQEFGLVYMPFREFMHLSGPHQALECLDSIHRHLRPDGRLIINLYNMDLVTLTHAQQSDPPLLRQRTGDYRDPETGRQVLLTSASRYRAEDQTLVEERFYDHYDEHGKCVERRSLLLTQRWYFRWEMEHLLQRAHFRVESVMGGYHGQPLRMGSEMIFIARPATERELRQELHWLENKLARFD
jgi:SAM-dependent methyltransferase